MNNKETPHSKNTRPLLSLTGQDTMTAIGLSIVTLGVYAFTAAPGVTMEDSADFMNGVLTLGVVHPPGYPLYTFLGHLFSYLPLGDPAFRVNLFSSLWGALCLGVMFLNLRILSISPLHAVSASLFLGFTPVFWSKTAVAEVYSLNAFLLAAVVFWILNYNRDKKSWQLYLTGLFTGLALANHYPLAILSGLGLLFLLDRRDLHLPDIFKATLFLVLGLTPYLYLFIQAYNPEIQYNFGKLSDPGMVLDHIRRKYTAAGPGGTLWDKSLLSLWYLKAVTANFLLGTLFLAVGVIFSFMRRWKYRIPFLLAALCPSIGLIFIINVPNVPLYRSYLVDFSLPAFMFFSVFVAFGLKTLTDRYSHPRTLQVSLLVIVLSTQVAFQFPRASHHNDRLPEIWGAELLDSLKPNSILILCDANPFLVYFTQLIRGVRKDVTIYDRFSWWTRDNLYEPELLFRMRHDPPGYRRRREQHLVQTSSRPVYYTCKDILEVEKIPYTPTPYVFRVDKKRAEASDSTRYTLSDPLLDALVNGYPRSDYWLDRARKVIWNRFISYYGAHHRPELNKITAQLKKTKLYSEPQFILSVANNLYFYKNYPLARNFYDRAEQLSPDALSPVDLAVYCSLLANERNYDKALGVCLRQEQSSFPCAANTVNTRQTIAAIFKEKENWPKVLQYSRKILECRPEHTVARNYLESALQRTEKRLPATELIANDEPKKN